MSNQAHRTESHNKILKSQNKGWQRYSDDDDDDELLMNILWFCHRISFDVVAYQDKISDTKDLHSDQRDTKQTNTGRKDKEQTIKTPAQLCTQQRNTFTDSSKQNYASTRYKYLFT